MIDHLVYATPDLQEGVQEIEDLLGVRATPGGQHFNWGTHNALLSLGTDCYLEIIAPDPNQSTPATVFQLANLQESKLVTWAAKAQLNPTFLAQAKTDGLHFGTLIEGSRKKPDGTLLSWQLTDPVVEIQKGIIPFLIDWGSSVHPAQSAAPAGLLQELRLFHPQPTLIRAQLAKLGIKMQVDYSPQPSLEALIQTPKGIVKL